MSEYKHISDTCARYATDVLYQTNTFEEFRDLTYYFLKYIPSIKLIVEVMQTHGMEYPLSTAIHCIDAIYSNPGIDVKRYTEAAQIHFNRHLAESIVTRTTHRGSTEANLNLDV